MAAVQEFFAMGGHAAFIWPALGLTAAAMVVMLVWSMRSARDKDRALESARGRDRAGAEIER